MSGEEVLHQAESSEARAAAVSDIHELMRRKEEIEAQIKANYDVLESQKGIGMSEPLVDCEGYPRADVDLYQVRTARHNIICLQNDHKALMKQVEEALHQLHARDKEKQARDIAEAREEARNRRLGSSSPVPPQAFARVNSISPGSPASIAKLQRTTGAFYTKNLQDEGLQVDDEIVEFGSVNTQNFQSLQNVGTVVQHSEGKPLNVTVIRRGEKHQLRLTPTRWAGKGLLGDDCFLDQQERCFSWALGLGLGGISSFSWLPQV
ncbi:26S proteasome non-ATPase regulatory subunit 9 [Apodemus speciosus]|uniref:26S proteasome non-ATPase regulatory subunit 9 n=1 Tax=Apodemus speciosus TaxID=105296 RepID=A0ABQ0ESW8_APOSI